MDGIHTFHSAKVGDISASGVQRLGIFDALLADPGIYFNVGKHDRTGLNSDGCGIGRYIILDARKHWPRCRRPPAWNEAGHDRNDQENIAARAR